MKALSFSGSSGEYFKIWIVNIGLILITLGIYYPWAKVRNKKYFYANTSLEERNFEYHATGKQLIVAYLIAMGLLIIYIVFEKIFPLISLGLILVLLVAIPWIILRSMLFNMKMTSFSNVHFSFTGKTKDVYSVYLVQPFFNYMAIAVVTTVVIMISSKFGGLVTTIGIIIVLLASLQALAYLKKIATNFLLNNTQYGQGKFEVNVTTNGFMIILLKSVGVFLGSLLIAFIVFGLVSYITYGLEYFVELNQSINVSKSPEESQKAILAIVPILGLLYFVMICMSIFVTAFITTQQRQYIFANTVLDGTVTFSSTLGAWAYGWLIISNFILSIVTVGLAIPWTKIRTARLIARHTLIESKNGFDEYLTQKSQEESSLGEQIGDAFDVDVGIAL